MSRFCGPFGVHTRHGAPVLVDSNAVLLFSIGDYRFELALLFAADEVALLLAAPLVRALFAAELVALLLAAPLALFEAVKPGVLKHRAATAAAIVSRFMKYFLSNESVGFKNRAYRLRTPDIGLACQARCQGTRSSLPPRQTWR